MYEYITNDLSYKNSKIYEKEHGYYPFLIFYRITNDDNSAIGQEGHNVRIFHRFSIHKHNKENMRKPTL